MTHHKTLHGAIHNGNNIHAGLCMFGSVLLYALMPVFIVWGDAKNAPFAFNAVITLFVGLGTFVFLSAFYRKQLFNKEIWSAVFRNLWKWSLFGLFASYFAYAIFSWSLKYIDVSVASVLFETWPLWLILMTGIMFKKENRYENINTSKWFFLLMGFAGLVFVVLSQYEELSFKENNTSLFYAVLGVILASISAILGAAACGCSIRWAATVLNDIPMDKQKETNKDLTIFFSLLALIVANIPGVAIGAALSAWGAHNETVELNNMAVAAILGLFISATGSILFRTANIMTTRLEINAIAYATPIFTLLYLATLGYINVPKTDWLVIGAMGVVVANILLSVRMPPQMSVQLFMIILWIFGTVVYFNPFLHTLLSFISDNIAIKSNAIGFIIEITVFIAASGAAFALLYFHNSKKHTMTPKPAINAIFTAQGISMFFCACIAATFGVLFWHKWMTSSNLLGGQ